MKTLFSLMFALVFLSGMYAEDGRQWIQRINQKYGDARSMSADFEQVNTWNELDVEKVSRGTMYYDGSRFAMKYSFPDGQFLLVDADSMLVYDAASKQAIITWPDVGDTGLCPDRILSQYAGDNARIEIMKHTNTVLTIAISPQDQQDIKRIIANIDPRNLIIESIQYTDIENNMVEYSFTNVALNSEVDSTVFQFSIPPDATLIDQRQ